MHYLVQALLNAAGILTAFLLSGTAVVLELEGGPVGTTPVLVALLLGAAAALAHATRQPVTAALVMALSVLPFAAWLVHQGWGSDVAVRALPGALGLIAAPALGAWTGHLARDTRRWRAGHSATVLLTMTAVLLIILAPLLLMIPR